MTWKGLAPLVVVLASCSAPRGNQVVTDVQSSSEPGPAGATAAAAESQPISAPVLVRLLVLDTNTNAPARLPDDGTFLRGATSTLAEVARCRASTGSDAHWVEIEWRVDGSGSVLGVVAHPVFIPPAGRPPAVAPETLRCIEAAASAPPFTASGARPPARVFALVGFELPELAAEPSDLGLRFSPEPDGHCRAVEDCPPTKHCMEPPRIPCPRAAVAKRPPTSSVELP